METNTDCFDDDYDPEDNNKRMKAAEDSCACRVLAFCFCLVG
jgi:hypothetical protein